MNKADELKEYLPSYYQESPQFSAICDSSGTELDSLYENISDVINQCFPQRATWGLKFWEEFLGITTDESKPYTSRRDRIIAKLRGAGTANIYKIKTIAKAYTKGEIEIIVDHNNYEFSINFLDSNDIKQWYISDLYSTLDEVKPAHLAYKIFIESPRVLKIDTKFSSFENIYAQCGIMQASSNQYNIMEG